MNGFEELKKYKELLDMGILTEEEFDEKRKEILEDLRNLSFDDEAVPQTPHESISLNKLLSSSTEKIKAIKESDELKAVTTSISDTISSSEKLSTIQEKAKEIPPNKKIMIGAAIVLIVILILSFGGRSGKGENSDDPLNKVKINVESTAMVHYSLTYNIKSCIVTVTSIEEAEDGLYTVYGKADIIDQYDDHWTSKFNGIYSEKSSDKTDIEYTEPLKN